MGGLSWWHWMIILAAFTLLFGAKKLPDAARGVGRSLRILKSEVNAMHEDEKASVAATAEPAAIGPASMTPPHGGGIQDSAPISSPIQPDVHARTS